MDKEENIEGSTSLTSNKIAKLDKMILAFLCLEALCHSVSTAGANIGLGGALLFFVIRFSLEREDIIARWKSFNCIILSGVACYLGSTYISGLFAIDHGLSLSAIMHDYVFKPLAFVIIGSIVKEKKDILILAVCLLLGVIITGLYAVGQLANYSMSHAGKIALEKRFSGSLHPVQFGCVLAAAIPALWVLLLNYHEKKKWLLWYAMGLMVIFAIMTGTRGAWLTIPLTGVIAMVMSGISKKKICLILMAACVALGSVVVAVPQLKNRVISITNTKERSKVARLQMWKSATNMFLDYPVTGVGVGCWTKAYGEKYILPDAVEKNTLGHAHNNFFHILAEKGMVGILGYLALIMTVFKCSYSDWKKHKLVAGLMLFIAWLSFCLQGLTEYSMGEFAPSKFLWTSLGMYISWRYLDSQSSPLCQGEVKP